MEYRPLGSTDIQVSVLGFGTWPIAGMSSADTNEADSLATLDACFELGINLIDTAYCYGLDGQSERLVGRAVKGRREQVVIATKTGMYWRGPGERVLDASPQRIRLESDESLRRLQTDYVDLLYLHAPDRQTPIEASAEALRKRLETGKARAIGVSNVNLAQLQAFAAVCPVAAYQPCYNMLQREIEDSTLPWCREHNVAVITYWSLMKGLLAGHIPRTHVFPTTDTRHKYPMFQGEEFQRNQDFVDALRAIAEQSGHTVAELVLNWTIHRPGITSVLCGGKRPQQLRENAGAVGWRLSEADLARIDEAIRARGMSELRTPV